MFNSRLTLHGESFSSVIIGPVIKHESRRMARKENAPTGVGASRKS
jgi:hypothetical protein